MLPFLGYCGDFVCGIEDFGIWETWLGEGEETGTVRWLFKLRPFWFSSSTSSWRLLRITLEEDVVLEKAATPTVFPSHWFNIFFFLVTGFFFLTFPGLAQPFQLFTIKTYDNETLLLKLSFGCRLQNGSCS